MARIRYKKVSALDGDEVPDDHIVKGYEVSKDRYIVVDPDELEPFIPAATKTVDLEEFVDLDEIDPVFYDNAYYVAPGTNPKPYVLLARAMEESNKVAIGRFVMRNKQYTAAIRAEEGRLIMSTLAYADEVLDPATIDELQELDDVDVSKKEIAMAESLVDSLSADVRTREVPRRVPRAGARPDPDQGVGPGVRSARGGRRAAEGGRSDGRARGERREGEGRPGSSPVDRRTVGEEEGRQEDGEEEGRQEDGGGQEVRLTAWVPSSTSRSRAAISR